MLDSIFRKENGVFLWYNFNAMQLQVRCQSQITKDKPKSKLAPTLFLPSPYLLPTKSEQKIKCSDLVGSRSGVVLEKIEWKP